MDAYNTTAVCNIATLCHVWEGALRDKIQSRRNILQLSEKNLKYLHFFWLYLF